MDQIGYYRYAAVARDTIVFVCEDDLWSVSRDGGVARRLTTSSGEVSTPRISPDGSTIAFVARDEGSPEVYTMAAGGGVDERLTFLGGDVCSISSWTPDGSAILFCTDANAPFARETHGYKIAASGGVPEPLSLGHARSLSQHADGRIVIGRNNDDPARWKRYRGGTAGDLWIDAHGTGVFARLVSLVGNPVWPMWVGERVFFLSDHEGVGNIYSVLPDGGDLRLHTNETEYFVRFPSTDGTTIAFTAGAAIYTLDPASGAVERVSVITPSSAPQLARRFIEIGDHLEHFSPSPDGTSLALISRGAAFTMPLWEEAVASHGAGSRVRYRAAEWLHDSKRFVCVSDEGGAEHLEVHAASGDDAPRKIAANQDIGRVVELAVSPTNDVVALSNHRHELTIVDLESERVRVIDTSTASHITNLAFSPDGRWLAYACAVQPDNSSSANADTSIVRIAKVKSGVVHDVTPLLRVDRAPAWDPDGKYLYFISTRDFNPVYDALQFDLSFPQASRPFLVTLRDDVPNPFVPKPAPLHRDRKDDEDDDRKASEKPVRIDIDFEGIEGRILGFPVDEGDYEQLVAGRGRALFTQFPLRGIKPEGNSWSDSDESATLIAYDFDQQRAAPIAHEVHKIRLAADHRTLVYESHDRIRAIDANAELPDEGQDEPKGLNDPGRRSGWLALSRASVLVEPHDEWRQMYDEAWRMQREQFWDAQMSGIDWDLVRERYAKLLPLTRTRTELSAILWEMLGELGTSHAYEIGGDHRTPPQYRRGFLGADLRWSDTDEGYTIVKIYRGDSWNRDIDSPLAEPGLAIHEGDVLHAIGGRALSRDLTPDRMLVNAAGHEVALTVAGRKKGKRRLVVRALRDERMLRYRAWVDANRALVHDATKGRVGYVHIPDMGPWGFAEFHRGYLSEFNRDALIVDVRYNRGGHVSPLLIEKLARKRVGWDVSRYGPPTPYPPESVGGPMVALTNQFAGSDGDIFSHVFKLYKLGPLVGKRTWGGVIGINPYHRLVDGTITTQPEFSFWFVDVGWKVENYGTDPDVDVDIAPHDDRAGFDPQMHKALELIEAARASANGKPHFEARPHLALPTELVSTT
ncbi:MAG: PD40 domain-containing protein [Candidatus Eremiobacteraeota bacterium]|nr:PD40 domain-containing protein [Candidatus Eremiobacteraeota bacterium]